MIYQIYNSQSQGIMAQNTNINNGTDEYSLNCKLLQCVYNLVHKYNNMIMIMIVKRG